MNDSAILLAGYHTEIEGEVVQRGVQIIYDKRSGILKTFTINDRGHQHGWYRVFQGRSLIFSHYWVDDQGVWRKYDDQGVLVRQVLQVQGNADDIGVGFFPGNDSISTDVQIIRFRERRIVPGSMQMEWADGEDTFPEEVDRYYPSLIIGAEGRGEEAGEAARDSRVALIKVSWNKPAQAEALRVIREVNAWNDDARVMAMVLNIDLSDPAKMAYWERVNRLMIERYRTKIVGLNFLAALDESGNAEAKDIREWAMRYSELINAFNMGKFGNDWASSVFREVARDSGGTNKVPLVSPGEELDVLQDAAVEIPSAAKP